MSVAIRIRVSLLRKPLITLSRWRTVGLAVCATAVAALWLLATPVVASQLMKLVERYPALDLRRPVAAQAVVILAGGVRRYAPEYNDDAPNEATLMRLVYGARVARFSPRRARRTRR